MIHSKILAEVFMISNLLQETETKSWDLGSLASALNQRSTNGVVESPSSTTVGDDGLRGNQIAPGVHASPEKTSQVVQEPDKESNNSCSDLLKMYQMYLALKCQQIYLVTRVRCH